MNFKIIFLFLKGLFIGFSTVLPGISGGTAAFILGIYHQLIDEISRFKFQDFKFLIELNHKKRNKSFKSFIKNYDWSFLLPLLLGVVVSALLFALWAPRWIEAYSFQFHALVFGLVLASLYVPLKSIKKTLSSFLFFVLSLGLSLFLFYFIDSSGALSLLLGEKSFILYLLTGFITALALVVPGLSGAYILILLGLYSPLLKALVGGDVFILSFFISGLIIGFFIMVRMMKLLLDTHFEKTQAVLLGFIIGSLFHLWPFSQMEIVFNQKSLEFLLYSSISFSFVFVLNLFYRK